MEELEEKAGEIMPIWVARKEPEQGLRAELTNRVIGAVKQLGGLALPSLTVHDPFPEDPPKPKEDLSSRRDPKHYRSHPVPPIKRLMEDTVFLAPGRQERRNSESRRQKDRRQQNEVAADNTQQTQIRDDRRREERRGLDRRRGLLDAY